MQKLLKNQCNKVDEKYRNVFLHFKSTGFLPVIFLCCFCKFWRINLNHLTI